MDAFYRFVNAVGRGALAALGAEVHWHGAEHIPRTGPVLLASTHNAFLDFVVLERVAVTRDRFVRFLTRADVWQAAGVGTAMDLMGHVPVDRAAPADAYLRARTLLRRGEAVGIFPEAGISHSYTVRALMPGAAALAAETGVPVVPVAMWGMQRVASVGDPVPTRDLTRGRRVDVHVGAPTYVPRDADVRATTVALGERLTELLEGLQRMPVHRPRPGEYAAWYPAHLGGRAPDVARSVELSTLPLGAIAPEWGPRAEVDAR